MALLDPAAKARPRGEGGQESTKCAGSDAFVGPASRTASIPVAPIRIGERLPAGLRAALDGLANGMR